MSNLLVWKEKLQSFYAKHSTYISKAVQFLTGLLLFGMINYNIGFMKTASSVFCTVGLAVICTFLPAVIMTLAAAALVLVHFYALSMPIAMISALIFFIMYIFYFRFTPGKSWILIVSVLSFGLNIPFVAPIVFGLLGAPVWIVPAGCGVIVYYMIRFVKLSATALKSSGAEAMTEGMLSFTKQVLTNREMWLMLMIIVIGILVVNAVKNRSVDHAWKIASVSGAAVCVVAAAAGNLLLDEMIPYAIIILSAVAGAAIGFVLEFVFFSVDYSRTENVQFEDDEYYYYVKAVPKVGVTVPDKKVKHITERQPESGEGSAENAIAAASENAGQGAAGYPGAESERNTEEILLTRSLSKELGLDQEQQNENNIQ